MTQVDFYILKSGRPGGRQLFACRLAVKAYKQGHTIYINTESPQQLRELDDLLWTFRDGSFLPHGEYQAGDGDEPPILLGHALEPEGPSDVLMNLSSDEDAFVKVLVEYRAALVSAAVTGKVDVRREVGT